MKENYKTYMHIDLYLITGPCPFAGLILWSSVHGHIGTFCQDGSITVPIGQGIELSYTSIAVIAYSLPGVANIQLTLEYETIYNNVPWHKEHVLINSPNTSYYEYFNSVHILLFYGYNTEAGM